MNPRQSPYAMKTLTTYLIMKASHEPATLTGYLIMKASYEPATLTAYLIMKASHEPATVSIRNEDTYNLSNHEGFP